MEISTAPMEPPSRTNTGSRPNANFIGVLHGVGERAGGRCPVRPHLPSVSTFTSGLRFFTKSLHELQDLLGILVRHEAAGDLHLARAAG